MISLFEYFWIKLALLDMEITEELKQIVNTLPEDVLGELLQYLRQIEKESTSQLHLSMNLNTVLAEDDDLLERLAQ